MPDVFITEDFLLHTDAARRLYHEYASTMPIIDYHCHLPPQQIAEDHKFANLAEIWLHGDHYKWRAMRANGIAERFCTGDASDWEKFAKWAETVPQTLRNPLYHWTHLELKRPFGIADRLLSPATAKSIWDECNAKLSQPEFSARGIMRQMGVVRGSARRMTRPTICRTMRRSRPIRLSRSRSFPPSGPTRRWPSTRRKR